jgi:hypothetical protein
MLPGSVAEQTKPLAAQKDLPRSPDACERLAQAGEPSIRERCAGQPPVAELLASAIR